MATPPKFALACLGGLFFFQPAFSQEYRSIQRYTNTPAAADAACFAGTVTVGQVIGQSNDTDLPSIYLCMGDSVLIDHNGDQVFMDSDPSTSPGISYALYRCPPTDTIVSTDPCLWPGAVGNGFFATNGPPSGDHWIYNTGALISSATFCNGNPCQIYFAPVTIDANSGGMLEPGCVNISAAFSAVYLKPISEKRPADGTSTVNTNFGNDCLGRFRLYGGLPEWDPDSRYTIDISLASDPAVKGLIYTSQALWKHARDIVFSVPESGMYKVTVEDGKSCGLVFQVDMSACDASDNIVLIIPDDAKVKGQTVCLPIRVKNLSGIIGASFSVSWDPLVLDFNYVQNEQPFVSAASTGPGSLGVLISGSPDPDGVTFPDKTSLLSMCFSVIGEPDTSSPVQIDSSTLPVSFDHAFGPQLAVSARDGTVTSRCRCPKFKRPKN